MVALYIPTSACAMRIPIPILMFHQIGKPPERGAPYRSLTVPASRFRRHMQWLAFCGWRGLSMHALMPYLRGEKTGKVFGLTFDDAYLNVHTHALPVLREMSFSATTYVVAGAIGKTNIWDAAEGVEQVPLMNRLGLLEWIAAGNEIGAHAWDHCHLTRCNNTDLRHQIVDGRRLLQSEFNRPIDAFCYPYGDYDDRVARLVQQAGYSNATTTERGRVHPDHDPYTLPRVHVHRHTPTLALIRKCITSYEDRRT